MKLSHCTPYPASPLPVSFPLGRDVLGCFEGAHRREWLVTNGIGGFASGTLGGANTRRYHGLLIAALQPPIQRTTMIAKFEITARYGHEEVPLSTNEFGDGTIAPPGFRHLETFWLEGSIPVWSWRIADLRLEQRLWMRHGDNTTYVQFTRFGGCPDLHLTIEPLCTYRDYHGEGRGERPFAIGSTPGGVEILAHDSAMPYRILCPDAAVTIRPQWHWNFKHRAEAARGLDDIEDLLRPAVFELNLKAGQSGSLTLTAERHETMPAAQALAVEQARQNDVVARFEQCAGELAPTGLPWLDGTALALAADQFVVERRDIRGTPLGKTIIAGYPWFGDWGRDTMIALPGLTLATGRPDIAVSILRTFAQFVSQGMLPNRFPDNGERPEYNTADASLWFFVAVHEYLRSSGDSAFAHEIYPTLKDMFAWHARGTRFGIGMDPADALLRAGEDRAQLTWMDVKVGDQVITPRIGKPVEVNALWFNAVSILRDLASELDAHEDYATLAPLAGRIRASFEETYWYESGGYLYDVADGPDGDADPTGRRRDTSLRPNQLFALSLPHSLFGDDKARRIIETCTTELWTPVGMRTLAATDPRYRGHYGGNVPERDGAYHQGTVWPWLLGAFVTAHYRVYHDATAALEFLNAIPAHMREACIGQVSEIMEGDPPFAPRGCFAQAWSIGEILRATSEINGCERHAPHVAAGTVRPRDGIR